MNKTILIGSKFGLLTVVKYIGSIKYQNTYLCKCDCGNSRNVSLTHLIRGKIISCGCKNFSKKHGNEKYCLEEANFRAKATNYKALAKSRGIDFKLSIDEAIILLKGNCRYCGIKPSNEYNIRLSNRINKNIITKKIFYNGIDRVDNDLGYIIGNTVSCCTKCNTAKMCFTLDEFKNWIIKLYKNLIENENNNNI